MPLRICTVNLIECISHPQNFWKYFNSVSEKPVTRSDFMSVLSNIEYILIKASYGQGLQQSRYLELSRILNIFLIWNQAEGIWSTSLLFPIFINMHLSVPHQNFIKY